MLKMFIPIFLVVFSNVFYNLSAKFTPERANSFLSLTVTYLTAAVLSFIAFCMTGNPTHTLKELSNINWSAFVMGLSIIGLELGYIFIYRVGWKVSMGSFVANIMLACILLLVGILLFKESITLRQMLGMLLCVIGLICITK